MNKILFVLGTATYPRVTGGMEIFNYYLIRSLKDKFNIYYTANNSLRIEGTKQLKTFHLRPTKYLTPLQLFFHLLFHPSIKKVLFSFSAAHAIVWKLYRMVCKILHRKYYVVIHHGGIPPRGNLQTYLDFFHNAECVVAVSEDIKKNYDAEFGINCRVIYPLVPFIEAEKSKSELRQQFGIESSRNVICMIGTIKPMKNPDTIIETLSLFTKDEIQKYNPHILYAGGGPSLETLKQLVKNKSLEDRVTFLGNVPKDRVNEVLKVSDYYLIASDFEGTSVSLLEAMFNHKPIISSRAPGIVNTISEGTECRMFTTKDAEALKQCFIFYIEDENKARNLSEEAYQHYLRDYNYEDVIRAYSEIFSN